MENTNTAQRSVVFELDSKKPAETSETNSKDKIIELPKVTKDYFNGPVRRWLKQSAFRKSIPDLYTTQNPQYFKHPHYRLLFKLFMQCDVKLECEKLKCSKAPRFTSTITIDGVKFEATESKKKSAHNSAARAVLLYLKSYLAGPPDDEYRLTKRGKDTFSSHKNQDHMNFQAKNKIEDTICDTAENKFSYEIRKRGLSPGDFNDMTTIVEVRKDEIVKCKAVAFATGGKYINHKYLNNNGISLLVSHSDVLARRGFLRYLYHQLLEAKNGNSKSVFTYVDGKYTLKDNVTYHLYMRSIPCGHAAIYTNKHNKKMPSSIKGYLRMNMLDEYTNKKTDKHQGSSYRQSRIRISERWKGIKVMTCSDKILRMNVLGVQGALLTYFINPIYFTSIVIHKGHDTKQTKHAFFGRVEENFPKIPALYTLNKPDVKICYRRSIYNHDTIHKSLRFNVNWTISDGVLEETYTTTGRESNKAQPSRLCKAQLFEMFKEVMGDDFDRELTYEKYKKRAKLYKHVKNTFYRYLHEMKLGTWIQSPLGVDDFDSPE